MMQQNFNMRPRSGGSQSVGHYSRNIHNQTPRLQRPSNVAQQGLLDTPGNNVHTSRPAVGPAATQQCAFLGSRASTSISPRVTSMHRPPLQQQQSALLNTCSLANTSSSAAVKSTAAHQGRAVPTQAAAVSYSSKPVMYGAKAQATVKSSAASADERPGGGTNISKTGLVEQMNSRATSTSQSTRNLSSSQTSLGTQPKHRPSLLPSPQQNKTSSSGTQRSAPLLPPPKNSSAHIRQSTNNQGRPPTSKSPSHNFNSSGANKQTLPSNPGLLPLPKRSMHGSNQSWNNPTNKASSLHSSTQSPNFGSTAVTPTSSRQSSQLPPPKEKPSSAAHSQNSFSGGRASQPNHAISSSLQLQDNSKVTGSSKSPGYTSVTAGSNRAFNIPTDLDTEQLKNLLKKTSTLASIIPNKQGNVSDYEHKRTGSDTSTLTKSAHSDSGSTGNHRLRDGPASHSRSAPGAEMSTNVSSYSTSNRSKSTSFDEDFSSTSTQSSYNYQYSSPTVTSYHSSPQSKNTIGSSDTNRYQSSSGYQSAAERLLSSTKPSSDDYLSNEVRSEDGAQLLSDKTASEKVQVDKFKLTTGISGDLLQQLRQIRNKYTKTASSKNIDSGAEFESSNKDKDTIPSLTLLNEDEPVWNSMKSCEDGPNQLISSWPPEPSEAQRSSDPLASNNSSINYDSATTHTYYTPKSRSNQDDSRKNTSQHWDGNEADSTEAVSGKPLPPRQLEQSLATTSKMTLSQYKALLASQAVPYEPAPRKDENADGVESLLNLPMSSRGHDPTPLTGAAGLNKHPSEAGAVLKLPISPREIAYAQLVKQSSEMPQPPARHDDCEMAPRRRPHPIPDDHLPPHKIGRRHPPVPVADHMSLYPIPRNRGREFLPPPRRRPEYDPPLDRPPYGRRREPYYDDRHYLDREPIMRARYEEERRRLDPLYRPPPRGGPPFRKRGNTGEEDASSKKQKTWPKPEAEKAPITEDLLPYVGMESCDICNVEYTHPIHAKAHLVGKNHHKKLKILGLPVPDYCLDRSKPSLQLKEAKAKPKATAVTKGTEGQEDEEEVPWPDWMQEQFLDDFCGVCNVPLSSATTADSHYAGKKHLKKCNTAYSQNLKGDLKDHPSSRFYCEICLIYCSSAEIMQQHKSGTKHKQAAHWYRTQHDKPLVSDVRTTEVDINLVEKKVETETAADDFLSMAAKMNGL